MFFLVRYLCSARCTLCGQRKGVGKMLAAPCVVSPVKTLGCQVYPEFEEESPCRRSGAAPSRELSSTGVSAKVVGAGLERFAGRERRGRSLAGLGGMEDSPDTENRPAERWGGRHAGGDWAQGRLTRVTCTGPGTLDGRCAGPGGPLRARMPRHPSSAQKKLVEKFLDIHPGPYVGVSQGPL